MDRAIAEEVFAACERAIAELSKAEEAIRRVSDADERSSLMQALGHTLSELMGSVRLAAIQQYPDLEKPPELGEPDTLLSQEEVALVSRLSPEAVSIIDSALLAQCVSSWRKVARVVMGAMRALPEELDEVPDGYFAQRVELLVRAGRLTSQGNLQYMRFSEVRLPHG